MQETEGRFKENIKKEIKQEISEIEDKFIEKNKLFNELKELFEGLEEPANLFYFGLYESMMKYDDIIIKLSNLAYKEILDENPSEAIDIGRKVLEISGIDSAKNISIQSPNGAVALAEAINWGAKSMSYSLYSLKPMMIVATSMTDGVFFGYGEDGTYSLGSPTIGIASFHDPEDEVGRILINDLGKSVPKWEHEWSGVSRQEDAFILLEDLNSGKGLVKTYGNITLPEEIKKVRDKYMKKNFRNRLTTIAKLLKN